MHLHNPLGDYSHLLARVARLVPAKTDVSRSTFTHSRCQSDIKCTHRHFQSRKGFNLNRLTRTCSRQAAAISSVDFGIHLSPGVMTHWSREPFLRSDDRHRARCKIRRVRGEHRKQPTARLKRIKLDRRPVYSQSIYEYATSRAFTCQRLEPLYNEKTKQNNPQGSIKMKTFQNTLTGKTQPSNQPKLKDYRIIVPAPDDSRSTCGLNPVDHRGWFTRRISES